MAVKKVGEELAYGISSDPKQKIKIGSIYIYPTSVGVSKEGEVKEYRGPAGTIIALVIPEQFDQLSIEGYVPEEYKGGVSELKKGDVCNLTGLTVDYSTEGSLRLEAFSVSWSNEDVAKISCTVKQYPDIPDTANG